MKKTIFKSIGAILAGVVFTIALSLGTDMLLQKTGVFAPQDEVPYPTWMLAVALVYRCFYGIAGAYITASLAPDKPMLHVLIPGVIGTLASIGGAIAQWDRGGHWYAIAIVVTAIPCAYLGGLLKIRQKMQLANSV